MKKISFLLVLAVIALLFYKVCSHKTGVIVDNTLHSNMQVVKEPKATPTTAKIYIDASGSMKGYFLSNEPDFNNVMGYLWGYANKQQVFFIGQNAPYTGLIANLLTNLKEQPNDAASPLDRLLPAMCKQSDNGAICFLVTDGIQSIGGNMQLALEQYKQGLKQSLSSYAANKAIAVLKYSSEFISDPKRNIHYYDMYDAKKNIHVLQRPYYVVAVGKKDIIRNLIENSSAKLHPEEQIYFGIHDYKGHNANKQQEDSAFKLQNTNKPITLSATLPKCLHYIDDNYIRDSITILQNGKNKKADVKYVHGNLLVVVNPVVAPAMSPAPDGYVTYNIKVKNSLPQKWQDFSSVNDSNIDKIISEQTKTFSLKYMLEGIKDAFDSEEDLIEIKYKFKY